MDVAFNKFNELITQANLLKKAHSQEGKVEEFIHLMRGIHHMLQQIMNQNRSIDFERFMNNEESKQAAT